MIKLCMLLLSLGSNVLHQDFIVQEEKVSQVESSTEVAGYILKADGNRQTISKNDYELISFPMGIEVKFCLHNQKLVIVTLNYSEVKLYELDYLGQVLVEHEFLSSFTNIDIISFKGSIYLVGGVDEINDEEIIKRDYHQYQDGVIIKLDSKYEIIKSVSLGGRLNDSFNMVKKDDKFLYIIGDKDTLSGGDFGNGGGDNKGFILSQVDEDLNVINYVIYKDKIFDFQIIDNLIYVVTDSKIYSMDKALNYKNSLEIGPTILLSKFSEYNSLLLINKEGIKIYDLTFLKIIKEIEINDIIYASIDKEAMYVKTVDEIIKVKIYDIRNFQEKVIYGEDEKENSINNLFRELPSTNKEISPVFDPMVKGDYDVTYFFDDLILEGKIIVPEEINITSGVIYPLGYRLNFTGIAYLNGVMVNNNHALMKTGKQELVIYDCHGKAEKYEFIVANEQISFNEDSNKNYELQVYPYEEFTIELKVKTNENIKITKVIINGEEYPFSLENGSLIINLKANMSGIYKYNIEAIEYENKEEVFTNEVSYQYVVKVLNPGLEVAAIITNDKKHILYNCKVEDLYQQIRGFKLYLRSNGEEIVYCYAVKTSDIVLRGLDNNKDYEATLMLQYSLNDKDLEELELIIVNIGGKSDVRLGFIDIIQAGDTLERFQVGFDIKAVSEVHHLQRLVYSAPEDDFFTPIFSGLLIGVVIGFIILYLRVKKKRKLI